MAAARINIADNLRLFRICCLYPDTKRKTPHFSRVETYRPEKHGVPKYRIEKRCLPAMF